MASGSKDGAVLWARRLISSACYPVSMSDTSPLSGGLIRDVARIAMKGMRSFERYAQSVCKPIHEIEIGDDLHDIQDAAILQARVSQPLNVLLPHHGGSPGQLLRKAEDRMKTFVERCTSPLLRERLGESRILSDQAESRPVMGHSILATVDRRYDDGDRFALPARKRRSSEHERSVE